MFPTPYPTEYPTKLPTVSPSHYPTATPTTYPTRAPTVAPTHGATPDGWVYSDGLDRAPGGSGPKFTAKGSAELQRLREEEAAAAAAQRASAHLGKEAGSTKSLLLGDAAPATLAQSDTSEDGVGPEGGFWSTAAGTVVGVAVAALVASLAVLGVHAAAAGHGRRKAEAGAAAYQDLGSEEAEDGSAPLLDKEENMIPH